MNAHQVILAPLYLLVPEVAAILRLGLLPGSGVALERDLLIHFWVLRLVLFSKLLNLLALQFLLDLGQKLGYDGGVTVGGEEVDG